MTEKTNKYSHYTKEELMRLLQERDQKPRFGLVWERNEIDHDHSINSDFVALDSVPELCNGQAPYRNLLIEGDNFDALRYLRMTHAGQVKCIYIDPPYNTGNKDFIYNDRFVDKDDAYKHSKWLEYMYRRLHLARELLRPDGVIFVSIGEEEQARLTLLMDNVFEGMKVGTFVWRRRTGAGDVKGAFLSVNHEYVLCYAGADFSFSGEIKDTSAYKNPDNDPRGVWIRDNLTCNKNAAERQKLAYPIIDPATGIIYPCNPKRVWAHSEDRMKNLIAEGKVLFPQNPNGTPTYKRHLSEVKSQEKPVSSWIFGTNEKLPTGDGEEDIRVLQSGMTMEGTKLLQQMLDSKAFNYPKPLSLLTNLIKQSTRDDDLIVDFFAGSGTTGHAVLALNDADNGNRRFILVSSTEATTQEPNKNICRDVAQKRLNAAVEGYSYTTKNGKKDVAGLGGDFAYCRTRRIPTHTVFNTIQHEQIWTALQLINAHTFGHYDATAPLQQMDYEKNGIAHGIIYLPNASDSTLQALQNIIQDDAKTVIVYAWQPAMAQQVLNNPSITVEPIPQYLVALFNAGARN